MFVEQRFNFPQTAIDKFQTIPAPFGFNGLGELTYYIRYSRTKEDGTQETWHDTIIRAMESTMSIWKDQYIKRTGNIFNDERWHNFAYSMTEAALRGRWTPPGRGLWAHGPFVWTRGAAALQNCGYVSMTNLAKDAQWVTDMLMNGVGIGFDTRFLNIPYIASPITENKVTRKYYVEDSREGWAYSIYLLIDSYLNRTWFTRDNIAFDYSLIRPEGSPINGFGGIASGPEPLRKLHKRIRGYLEEAAHMALRYGKSLPTEATIRLVADICNAIGACVIAGNVRRSAEIALGDINSETFVNLKNYDMYPERSEIGWMSNNTVVLNERPTAEQAEILAERIIDNGEPGIMNSNIVQNYGRYGEERDDWAVGVNPCGEIPLESHELCCLAEVFPTNCEKDIDFYEALHYATFYASTVALLPTHSEETNEVRERNKRIGVSITGIADHETQIGWNKASNMYHSGYEVVKTSNRYFLGLVNSKPSVRVTTVKPSGTLSLLMGVSPGMHWPTFSYAIRRVRQAANSPLVPILIDAGIPYEEDAYSDNTLVFSFPISHGGTRPATNVPVYTQAVRLVSLQYIWSDNAVSCTLYFDPEKEKGDVQDIVQFAGRFSKAFSMLPHTKEGVYEQPPYEGISSSVYEAMAGSLQTINWETALAGMAFSDGVDSRFCDGDSCEISF